MAPANFEETRAKLAQLLGSEPTAREVVTSVLYPKVYEQYALHRRDYYDPSGLPTPVFFYGPEPGEEISLDLEPGKTLIIRYLTTGEPHADGRRTVFFEVNGIPREVSVLDHSQEPSTPQAVKADPNDPSQVGSAMPGMVVTVAVQPGDPVKKGQKLLSLEAMKMETSIQAEIEATVIEVLVKPGSQVETGDLLVRLKTG